MLLKLRQMNKQYFLSELLLRVRTSLLKLTSSIIYILSQELSWMSNTYLFQIITKNWRLWQRKKLNSTLILLDVASTFATILLLKEEIRSWLHLSELSHRLIQDLNMKRSWTSFRNWSLRLQIISEKLI